MTSWEYEPGGLYYLVELVQWAGKPVPHVSTWVFDPSSETGLVQSSADSERLPYSFSALLFDRGWKASSVKRIYDDLQDASRSMVPWDKVMSSVADLDDRLKALGRDIGHPGGGEFLDRAIQAAMTAASPPGNESNSAGPFRTGCFYYNVGFVRWRCSDEPVVTTSVFNGKVVPSCAARRDCRPRRVLQFSEVINVDVDRPETRTPGLYRDMRRACELFRSWEELLVSGEATESRLRNRRRFEHPMTAETPVTSRRFKTVHVNKGNGGDEAIEKLVDKENVGHIVISSPKISYLGLASLRRLPNLQALEVRRRQVSHADLTCLQWLPKLRDLAFFDCRLSESASTRLSTVNNLRTLAFHDCRLAQAGWPALADLEQLRMLYY